jgi:hypothetical protein
MESRFRKMGLGVGVGVGHFKKKKIILNSYFFFA